MGLDMRLQAGRNGYVIAWCDQCPNTTEFIGMSQAPEKLEARGWTIRGGKAKCPACTEIERLALARAVWRS